MIWIIHICHILHNATVLSFRISSWKYEFILILLFATDEINRNPYLLPNMSLLFSFPVGMCLDTLKIIDELISSPNSNQKFPNYVCRLTACDIGLTGPSWTMSSKLEIITSFPKVRLSSKRRVNSWSVPIPGSLREWMGSKGLDVLIFIFLITKESDIDRTVTFPYITRMDELEK